MKRRDFLQGCLKAGVVATASVGFPSIVKAYNQRPTLRVLGTHVTLQEPLRLKAQEDLGINIEFYPGGSAEVLLKGATNPHAFDIYEQWSNSLRVLWEAGTIKPIQVEKLTYWNEINSLTKTGKIAPQANIGAGDAPYKLLYVQENGDLNSSQTNNISFLPYVHNVDSYGYNSNAIQEGVPYKTESWGWLLDEKHRGKVAIVNAPAIGLFDMALAVKAQGFMDFKDLGAMSREEVDQLFDVIVEYKRKGHFRGVWSTVPDSVNLMASGEVTIQSMFSPGVSSLNGMGIPCVYAAPKEGYRAWHGVMCLSSECRGEQEEAAYAFMNWWLSGWPGAFIARQGYYISNSERSRSYMSPEEWDYWYEGKPAAKSLYGTDGKLSVKEGAVRTGGSYKNRFSNIAVWNTVMPTYEYTLLKWNEFLMA